MSIGVAILGSGNFVQQEHFPAVQASSTLTLKAIYSRSLKSAKTLVEGTSDVDLYSDDSEQGRSVDDLLARSDIQAVIIVLPILNQPTYIRKALSAGKHVLSEKPIAENMKDAIGLLQWYRNEIDSKKIFWSVAENYRFLNSFDQAAKDVKKMGRVLGFKVEYYQMLEGGKYFETEWRKVPTHQGGFLLDGGVHFVAGMRLLLGPDEPFVSVSAHSTQLQKHLPPVDTVDATLKTKNGVTGTISISFGSTFKGSGYSVACEKGVVNVFRDKVKVGDATKDVANERTGVPPEVRTWGEAIVAGRADPRQSPEEALADLELLEAMLRSGEQNGQPISLRHQIPTRL